MISFDNIETGTIEVVVDGKVEKEPLHALHEECDRVAKESGGLKLLVNVRAIEGVTPKGLIEDLKLEADLTRKLDRVAFVSDKGWLKTVTDVATKPFSFESKTFEPGERDAALGWLR